MSSSTRRFFIAGSALSSLTACSTIPADGPSGKAVTRGAEPAAAGEPQPYVLVDVNEQVARAVAFAVPDDVNGIPFTSLPRGAGPGAMGAGDLLKVTLWEPSATGATMLDRPGTELLARVGMDGTLTVPFVGRIRAAGKTPAMIEVSIRSALSAQGHEMQVATVVSDDVTNSVTVQGDIVRPGRHPIVPGARGLLDVIAMAGGSRSPNHSSEVRVTRAGVTGVASMAAILANPELNVQLSPGDRVMLLPKTRFFYAFGSVNKSGEQPYDSDEISMARTLARIAGLSSVRADPSAVFVYRRQDANLTRRLAAATLRPDQDPTQVIYRFDLRNPRGFFLTEAFRIRPEDIVYVSEAPLAEVAKVLQIISGVTSIASAPRTAAGF